MDNINRLMRIEAEIKVGARSIRAILVIIILKVLKDDSEYYLCPLTIYNYIIYKRILAKLTKDILEQIKW